MAVFLSVVALTYNSETEEKKRRNRKRWRNRKVWTKPSLSAKKLARIEASPICYQQFANLFADCFCASLTYQLEFANTSLATLVCRVKAALGLLIEEERRPYWFPLFHILRVVKGGSRSRFTENKTVLSQFTKNKGIMKITVHGELNIYLLFNTQCHCSLSALNHWLQS